MSMLQALAVVLVGRVGYNARLCCMIIYKYIPTVGLERGNQFDSPNGSHQGGSHPQYTTPLQGGTDLNTCTAAVSCRAYILFPLTCRGNAKRRHVVMDCTILKLCCTF